MRLLLGYNLVLTVNVRPDQDRMPLQYVRPLIVSIIVAIVVIAGLAIWWFNYSPTYATVGCTHEEECGIDLFAVSPTRKHRRYIDYIPATKNNGVRLQIVKCHTDNLDYTEALVVYEKRSNDWKSTRRIEGWTSWEGVEETCKRLYRKNTAWD